MQMVDVCSDISCYHIFQVGTYYAKNTPLSYRLSHPRVAYLVATAYSVRNPQSVVRAASPELLRTEHSIQPR